MWVETGTERDGGKRKKEKGDRDQGDPGAEGTGGDHRPGLYLSENREDDYSRPGHRSVGRTYSGSPPDSLRNVGWVGEPDLVGHHRASTEIAFIRVCPWTSCQRRQKQKRLPDW